MFYFNLTAHLILVVTFSFIGEVAESVESVAVGCTPLLTTALYTSFVVKPILLLAVSESVSVSLS